MAGRLFTSESVTEGHPDKIADRISDSVLDHLMAEDPDRANLRVAVETLLTTGLVVVAGEVRTGAYAPVADIVRKAILEIGYDSSEKGFDGTTCGVQVAIGAQSSDIAAGVDAGHESRVGSSEDELDKRGAGDQGLMFGYACDDTAELMPLPITIAQRLAQRLTEVRKDGVLDYLRPDGKTQVTIEYDEDDRAVRLDTVVVSSQHAGDIDLAYGPADQLNAALTTLRQLAWAAPQGWSVPCGTISDAPRFAHRGFMLDDSRHFTGPAGVKRLLDAMELLKLNVFHWHLTDSPGWRIEIKKYPKLTTIGAQGNHTDPQAAPTFYTQDEVREIVAYARARGIAIIPEIDMPGHASAANRAYPEFSGGGSKKNPDFTFNPVSPAAEAFLRDILTEVRALFPAARSEEHTSELQSH